MQATAGSQAGGGAGSVAIRPSFRCAARSGGASAPGAPCAEDGFVLAGTQRIAGVVSGCGQRGAAVAAAARQLLAAALDEQQQQLVSASLTAAFERVHQQLLQPQQQQQQQPQLDARFSGASCLVACLDLGAGGQLLVASAGLCRGVLARSSPQGALTVMELSPRLALGHDPAETARLDAAGSAICYAGAAPEEAANNLAGGELAAAAPPPQGGGCSGASAFAAAAAQHQPLSPMEPVLLGPDGQLLAGVGASRLLGCSAASAAGVLATPVVTRWRLTGAESFVVLGSPGLWAAMSPAEVVDYIAAALASGVVPAQPPGGADCGAAATLLADVLTLEAQERLKLRLADGFFGAGAVPDVTAVVLLLQGAPALRGVAVDAELLSHELARVNRACRSNAEAQALQAAWRGSPSSTSICSSAASGSLAGSANSDSSSSCPALSPPSPALSGLLPVLSVAGHCWPAAAWPGLEAVRVPSAAPGSSAGQLSTQLVGSPTLEEAACAAGILHRAPKPDDGGSDRALPRSPRFALSSRLSCELDLSHDHGSAGSCGCCLATECAAAAAVAARTASGQLSESPASDQQSMIVHKVRLSGPCELESLLFGSATTAFPDTTVARILRPQRNGSASASAGRPAGHTSLLHAYSWASADALSGAASGAGGGFYAAAPGQRQRGCWSGGGGAMPRRSASVSMGLLAAQRGSHAPCSIGSAASGGLASSSGGGPSSAALGGALNVGSCRESPAWGGLCSPVKVPKPQHAGSLPAAAQGGDGLVSKARSYQALTALQAAGSGIASVGSASCFAAASTEVDGAGLLMHSSSLGGAAQDAAQGAFRPAFRSALAPLSPPPRRSHDGLASAGEAQGAQRHSSPAALLAADPLAAPAPVSGVEIEGKVRGGVSRSRRNSYQLLGAASGPGTSPPSGRSSCEVAAAGALAAAARSFGSSHNSSHNSSSNSIASASASDAASSRQQQPTSSPDLQAAVAAADAAADAAEVAKWSSLLKGTATRASKAAVAASSKATAAAGKASAKAAAAAAWAASKSSGGKGSAAAQPQEPDAAADAAASDGGSPLQQQRQQAAASPFGGLAESQGQLGSDSSLYADQPEPCVRGGRVKAARLRTCASTSDLIRMRASLEAATAARGAAWAAAPAAHGAAASRGYASWEGSALAASVAACEASAAAPRLLGTTAATGAWPMHQQAQRHKHPQPRHCASTSELMARRRHSISGGFGSSSSAGSSCGEMAARSPSLAALLATRMPLLPAAEAAAAAGSAGSGGLEGLAAAISREASGLLSEGSAGADGAVHGGELGEQALEGQVHGGRRSNSLSMNNSLVMSLSLPSSAGDDEALASACLSPSASLQGARQVPSALELPSCDGVSAGGRPPLSPSGSFTGLSQPPPSAGRAPSGGIEVLRMPSGSFTRVRLAASAPAATAEEDLGSAGADTDINAPLPQQLHAASCGVAQQPALSDASSGSTGVCAFRSAFGSAARPTVAGMDAAAGGVTWSSSRAWGSTGPRKHGLHTFPRASGGDGGDAPGPAATAAQPADSPGGLQGGSAGAGLGSDAAGPSGVSALLLGSGSGGGCKRQRSMPLPPLQESPVPTPSASPELRNGFMAAYEAALASQLGQPRPQPGAEQQAALGAQLSQRLAAHAAAAAQQQQQQHGGDHSMPEYSATALVLPQSLQAEAQRSSEEPSTDLSSAGLSGESLASSQHTFEFSRPAAHDGLADSSPLLGSVLLG